MLPLPRWACSYISGIFLKSRLLKIDTGVFNVVMLIIIPEPFLLIPLI
jgi:hypothetical protein